MAIPVLPKKGDVVVLSCFYSECFNARGERIMDSPNLKLAAIVENVVASSDAQSESSPRGAHWDYDILFKEVISLTPHIVIRHAVDMSTRDDELEFISLSEFEAMKFVEAI